MDKKTNKMKNIFILVSIFVVSLMACQSKPTSQPETTSSAMDFGKPEEPSTAVTQEPVSTVTPEAPQDNTPQNSGNFVLSGAIADAAVGQNVEIVTIPYDNSKPVSIAKTKILPNGQFKINWKHPGKGVYSLKLSQQQQLIFLLDGTEKNVDFSVPKGGFRSLAIGVKGSDINRRYYEIMQGVINKTMNASTLQKSIREEKSPLVASLIALQTQKDANLIDLHRSVQKRLAAVPNLDKKRYIDAYAAYIASMERQLNQAVIKVGAMAPDLAYKNPDGKIMKLSDLRGKLVLLDFWASWCGPCRRANPHVVEIYHKYKNKGFTVFSVSLDGDKRGSTDPNVIKMHKERWVNAIKKDGLVWPNHVSDLKSWNSEASAKYGVTSIPATFLIGRDGRIKAINPRTNLEEVVKANL